MAEIRVIEIPSAAVLVDKADFDSLLASAQENQRLRKQLSARLQELERIKRKRLDWAMLCDHDCPACTELDDAIRGDVPQTSTQTTGESK